MLLRFRCYLYESSLIQLLKFKNLVKGTSYFSLT